MEVSDFYFHIKLIKKIHISWAGPEIIGFFPRAEQKMTEEHRIRPAERWCAEGRTAMLNLVTYSNAEYAGI
jgi:hypothetical protein